MTLCAVPFDVTSPNLGLIVGAAAFCDAVDHLVLIDYGDPTNPYHRAGVERLRQWLGRMEPLGSVRALPNGTLSDAWNVAAAMAVALAEFGGENRPWRLLVIDQDTIVDTDTLDELAQAVIEDADVAHPGIVLDGRAFAVGAQAGEAFSLCREDHDDRVDCAVDLLGVLTGRKAVLLTATGHVL